MVKSPTKKIEKTILEEIEKQNTTVAWLANRVGVTGAHLHYVLRGRPGEKRKLSQQLLDQINQALGTDFKLETT